MKITIAENDNAKPHNDNDNADNDNENNHCRHSLYPCPHPLLPPHGARHPQVLIIHPPKKKLSKSASQLKVFILGSMRCAHPPSWLYWWASRWQFLFNFNFFDRQIWRCYSWFTGEPPVDNVHTGRSSHCPHIHPRFPGRRRMIMRNDDDCSAAFPCALIYCVE